MTQCPRCGAAFTPGQQFCVRCGLRVDQQAPPPPPNVVPPPTPWGAGYPAPPPRDADFPPPPPHFAPQDAGFPQWQTGAPVEKGRSRGPVWLYVAIVAVAVVVVAAGVGVALVLRNTSTSTSSGSGPGAVATGSARGTPTTSAPASPSVPTTQPPPSPTTSAPSPSASYVGNPTVSLSPALGTNPLARPLVDLLTRYFEAISTRNYSEYISVFRSSSVTPEQFATGYESTTNSPAQILAISTADDGRPVAVVHFTSRQDAADGPNGETCSTWTVSFFLDEITSGQYLFGKPPGDYHASHVAC